MAAVTMSSTQIRSFNGLKASSRPVAVQAKVAVPARRRSVITRADYIGSATNIIMVTSITAQLAAGRFGLSPSSALRAGAGLKLAPVNSGLTTGDPAGFSAVDVLAHGAVGHVWGVGIVLGLRAVGAI